MQKVLTFQLPAAGRWLHGPGRPSCMTAARPCMHWHACATPFPTRRSHGF